MKFFAPTANWDMKSSESWWPMMGTAPSSAGVRVSQETALTYAAAFAATRVISETLASMPLMLLEQVDDRTTRKATDHPLYPLIHDMPNVEQDIVSWIDTQVDRQANWGNAYAEIQRDNSGAIVALWPIHTSRIPVCNIERNATNPSHWHHIQVGQPGEIVYYVKNDDGTESAIPASDILNVPGVLSRNGITGVPIPVAGSESLGIAIATERHAGAFFRNGAVSNMALKHPKTVGKEAAERLREQWQKTYGGAHNHYKTIILEEGMEPVDMTFAPEASQLLGARQYGVNDIARLYRVPPHMIGDLSRATWANIESEEIAFVTHTMLPWITRWEKAMYRQLLTPEERARYRF
jgi:HK97 family phage portal protein